MSEASEGSEKMVYKAYVDFTPSEDVRLGMTVTIYPVRGKTAEQQPAEEEAPTEEPAEKTAEEDE